MVRETIGLSLELTAEESPRLMIFLRYLLERHPINRLGYELYYF